MKRFRTLLVVSTIVGILALAGAWLAISSFADRKARELLSHSREFFVQMIENTLDGTMWYAGSMAGYLLDYATAPRSTVEMQKLADLLYMDEVTLVGTNGIAVASNVPDYVGFDWHQAPETTAFLELFNPSNRAIKLMQPFRRGVIGEDQYCKFGVVAYTNRLGLVLVGYSMDRLVETLKWSEAKALKSWKFGRYGRFGAVDRDGDGFPDAVDPLLASLKDAGHADKLAIDGCTWLRLTFPFAGRVFYAEVPDCEFGDQRNAAFVIAAFIIIVLMLIFLLMLVRLQLSSEKVEKLHREAERRVAEDLKLAHTIQMSTLPHESSFNSKESPCKLDALMVPAREVGGDLYDFFTLVDGKLAFVIGDVSGKGIPAAMFMLVAKNAVRQALHAQNDAAAAMAEANSVLCADNEAGMFVTMVLGILDLKSGDISYVNAGHNRPFVVRANGTIERLEPRGGRMLGLYPSIGYRASRLHLESDDRLFLYTDGVTEAMDAGHHLYGEARLRSVLMSQPSNLCAAVRADVEAHVAHAPASDDLAMLTIRWLMAR